MDTAVDKAVNRVEVEIKEGCLRENERNRNSVYAVSERAFDICASAVAIILLSPILLIISAIVYLGDPGLVIYGQVRIGKNGKAFKM